MSCGVPLVATTGGALPEVVGTDNDTALLVPARRQRGPGRRHRPGPRRPRAAGPHRSRRTPAGHRPLDLAPHRRGHRRALPGPAGRDPPHPGPTPRRGGTAPRYQRRRVTASEDADVLTADYDRLGLRAGDRLLDLGCGFGRHAFEALRRGARVVACDMAVPELQQVRATVDRHARGRARSHPSCSARRCTGDATRLPVRRRHVRPHHRLGGHGARPRRRGRPRRAHPGAAPGRHHRRHRAGLAAREDLLGPLRRVPRPVRRGRPRPHLHRGRAAPEDARRRPRARRSPPGPRPALAVLVAAVRRRAHQRRPHPLVRAYTKLLEWDIVKRPPSPGSPSRPSTRCSASPSSSTPTKPVQHAGRGRGPAVTAGSADDRRPLRRRRHLRRPGPGDRRGHRLVAAAQRHDPLVPRRPRRPVEPRRGGHGPRPRRACSTEAERAYQWLVDVQRARRVVAPVLPGRRASSRTSSTPTPSPTSPPGVWHHWLLTGDRGFVETMWPVVRDGHRLRARPADPPRRDPLGPPRRRHPVVVRPAHRLVEHLPQPALRGGRRRAARPRAARLGAQRRPPGPASSGPTAPARPPTPSPRRPGGPWTGTTRCWAGCCATPRPTARLDARRDAFVVEGRGVRCVSDRPWITAAETCECLMAELSVGNDEHALQLFRWAQELRDHDGHYWTGIVFPDEVHFPGDERTTYTDAAVVLAADALSRTSPAAGLFIDHDALPALVEPRRRRAGLPTPPTERCARRLRVRPPRRRRSGRAAQDPERAGGRRRRRTRPTPAPGSRSRTGGRPPSAGSGNTSWMASRPPGSTHGVQSSKSRWAGSEPWPPSMKSNDSGICQCRPTVGESPTSGDHVALQPGVVDRATEPGQGVDAADLGVDQVGLVPLPPGLVLLGAPVVVEGEQHRVALVGGRAEVDRADFPQ